MAKRGNRGYSPNDHRSMAKNPNNSAYHAAAANRAAQSEGKAPPSSPTGGDSKK